ncbi:MAG: radical SAM protein [Bacteroidota bacterium]
MILSPEILKSYNQSRINTDKRLVCHAPSLNINFEQNGNARACCYNTEHILGKWPQQSIKQMWEGEKANELREYIRDNNFGGGCIECGRMIEAGNYHGVRAKYYDEFGAGVFSSRFNSLMNKFTGKISYPKVMEFELSNTCNLECVMCNGYFSSSIRKNREKLPAIESPYNEKFVDELEEFIPHLTDAKFLGGEPFMIDIYLSIWERILKINPSIRIHITTNGTFLNNRIKNLLEGLHAGIIMSMDSVVKETYQKIRVNGNYEKVMENLEYFMDYSKRKKTFISIAACPIVYNWKELPGMLEFCLSKNIALYFNAVFTPFELSLREQTIELQEEILAYLESYPLPSIKGPATLPRNLSIHAYTDFIKQLKGWLEERKQVLKQKDEKVTQIVTETEAIVEIDPSVVWSVEKISSVLLSITSIEGKGLFDEEKKMKRELEQLLIATPKGKLQDSLACFLSLHDKFDSDHSLEEQQQKLSAFSQYIEAHAKRNQALGHLSTLSPLFIAGWFNQTNAEQMQLMMEQFLSVR